MLELSKLMKLKKNWRQLLMADFDYQKMNDYVTADPEVAELREKRN